MTSDVPILFSYVTLPHLQPPWLFTPLTHLLLPTCPLLNHWPLKYPPLLLLRSPWTVLYIPRFLKQTYEGLVDGYSLETTVDRYVGALENVEGFDDLQMVTSVFKYVFDDFIWSSRVSTIWYSNSGSEIFIKCKSSSIFVEYSFKVGSRNLFPSCAFWFAIIVSL